MMRIGTIIYTSENEKWYATPSTSLLHRISERDYTSGTSRWIAVLEREGRKPLRIALGDPRQSREYSLDIPSWLLMEEGFGEEYIVKYEKAEKYKKAKKLVFRALCENTTEDLSLEDFLEEPLSQLGVIEEGDCILVPILEIPLLLEKTEPSGEPIFLDGTEVALEILWSGIERENEVPKKESKVPNLEKKIPEKERQLEDFTCMLPFTIPGVSQFYKV